MRPFATPHFFAQPALAILVALVSLPGTAAATTASPDTQAFCLGRYSLALPTGAQVHTTYQYAGNSVTTQRRVDAKQFTELVAKRVGDQSGQPHQQGGTMLFDFTDVGQAAVLVTTWARSDDRKLHSQELFRYFPQENLLLIFRRETEAKQHADTLAGYRALAQATRYRADNEIPRETGFCIDSGFIAQPNTRPEKVLADVSSPAHPGMTLRFATEQPGAAKPVVLQAPAQAGWQVMRDATRQAGGSAGRELIGRAAPDGGAAYTFAWQAPVKRASAVAPDVSIRLNAPNQAFASQDAALATWDGLLSSLKALPSQPAK